jgi:MYXO-CTERM domain-containing protein
VAVCGVVAALAILAPTGAQGAEIKFKLSVEFSGAVPPEGATPWLTATFDDHDTAGSVDLTLETTNLVDEEFVFEWLFNLDPTLDVEDLVFSAPTKTGAFTDPVIDLEENDFKADGDGYFDIEVMFDNSGGAADYFGPGVPMDKVEYTITGIPTLTANSFDFQSVEGGGAGTWPTAAHVGGIGSDDQGSGWVSTPEPASLSLLVLGAFAAMRRRR